MLRKSMLSNVLVKKCDALSVTDRASGSGARTTPPSLLRGASTAISLILGGRLGRMKNAPGNRHRCARVAEMDQSSISSARQSGFLADFDRLLRASATRTAREHRDSAKVPAPPPVRIAGFRNQSLVRSFTFGPVGSATSRGPDVH
jgi:hypothetical protein